MKKERFIVFDSIKVVLTMAVIMIHVTSFYVTKSELAFLLNQMMRFAVPSFFIVSGFLTYMSFGVERKYTYFTFIKSRMKRILIPYMLWTVFYTFFSFAIERFAVAQLGWVFIKNILLGTAFTHFYYLYALLQLYLCYPFVLKWLNKNANVTLFISLGISLVAQSLVYFDQMKWIELPDIGVGYSRLFPIWIFYFVLGSYLCKQQQWFAEKLMQHKKFIYIGTVLSFFALLYDSIFTKTNDLSMKPSVILYAVLVFGSFYLLAGTYYSTFIEKKHQSIRWLSEHSFFVFLFHPAVVLVVNRVYEVLGWKNFGQSGGGIFLTFILVFGVSYLVSYLLSYFTFAALVGGVHQPKEKIRYREQNNSLSQ